MTLEHEEQSPAMRSALAIIHREHNGLATALHSLKRYLKPVLEQGQKPNHDLFATILSYVDTFMDRFHHPKEDEHLFRALRTRTDRADGALAELQHDHATGPAMLRELQEALGRTRGGSASDIDNFANLLQHYTALQIAHMRMEHELVIPIAREALGEQDWKTIDEAFRDNLDPFFGTGARGSMGTLFPASREIRVP